MEEVLLRFSHIGHAIFKELNGKDFCISREVGRSWYHFIKSERALKKAYKKRIQGKVQTLNQEIHGNYYLQWKKTEPFHLSAERGYLPVCQQIIDNVDEKNPKDFYEKTPFHFAAENGHLSVCQLILENVDDKNPRDYNGKTPFHFAAENGHFEICQLIIANVDDKNPKDDWKITPLHNAAESGHFEICQLIIDNVDDKNPKNQWGLTPIEYAAQNGPYSLHHGEESLPYSLLDSCHPHCQ